MTDGNEVGSESESDSDSEPTDGETTDPAEEDPFEGLEAGAGCTEIWEHLSKQRGD